QVGATKAPSVQVVRQTTNQLNRETVDRQFSEVVNKPIGTTGKRIGWRGKTSEVRETPSPKGGWQYPGSAAGSAAPRGGRTRPTTAGTDDPSPGVPPAAVFSKKPSSELLQAPSLGVQRGTVLNYETQARLQASGQKGCHAQGNWRAFLVCLF